MKLEVLPARLRPVYEVLCALGAAVAIATIIMIGGHVILSFLEHPRVPAPAYSAPAPLEIAR